jgi:hypothetical protein
MLLALLHSGWTEFLIWFTNIILSFITGIATHVGWRALPEERRIHIRNHYRRIKEKIKGHDTPYSCPLGNAPGTCHCNPISEKGTEDSGRPERQSVTE